MKEDTPGELTDDEEELVSKAATLRGGVGLTGEAFLEAALESSCLLDLLFLRGDMVEAEGSEGVGGLLKVERKKK